MPASCEACAKEDLLAENLEAWQFHLEYPSLIRCGMDGWLVDYQSAISIMDRLYMPNVPLMLKKLEAIKTGYASVKKPS